MERGIDASFIQKVRRRGEGKIKSIPASSASVCLNRKPFACCAEVSASSTCNVSFPIWISAVRNPFASFSADGVDGAAGLKGLVDLKGVLDTNGVTEGEGAVKGVTETLGIGDACDVGDAIGVGDATATWPVSDDSAK